MRSVLLASLVSLVLPLAAAAPAAADPAAETALPPYFAIARPVTAEKLGATWRPECPVRPDELRLVTLRHVGMDGRAHTGELVVNQDRVAETITIFGELYRMRFPIEKMRTPDHYPNADDELSMRDNNTSAYNCRGIGNSGRWSYHAYGRAIDINPKINPYLDDNGVQPANGGPWLDRTRQDPGMLHDGDPAVLAFTQRGWDWGGHWTTPLDYQHFEKP
ncbi:M15 family metallopeptidase [Streptoalloteichus tenebrarius]|nr:M15 family metallopeptidase [Streptoalloteichus tenebrarius]